MNKLTWYISEVTPEVVRRATNLQKTIRETCLILPEDENNLINFSYFLAATRKMEYPPAARESVKLFSKFLQEWKDWPIADVWLFHQENVSQTLRGVWNTAFNDAQELFEVDPVEGPDEALTDEQRQAAATPGSPLTSRGASSHSG